MRVSMLASGRKGVSNTRKSESDDTTACTKHATHPTPADAAGGGEATAGRRRRHGSWEGILLVVAKEHSARSSCGRQACSGS